MSGIEESRGTLMNLVRTFRSGAQAPASARRALDDVDLTLAEEDRESVRLIVSELVTNAVLHGGCGSEAPVRLRIDRRPSSVRMEVVDEGEGFTPVPRVAADRGERGRGLLIVERLAQRWGVDTGRGTTVWAELALS